MCMLFLVMCVFVLSVIITSRNLENSTISVNFLPKKIDKSGDSSEIPFFCLYVVGL